MSSAVCRVDVALVQRSRRDPLRFFRGYVEYVGFRHINLLRAHARAHAAGVPESDCIPCTRYREAAPQTSAARSRNSAPVAVARVAERARDAHELRGICQSAVRRLAAGVLVTSVAGGLGLRAFANLRSHSGTPNTCAQTDVAPRPLHNSPADIELGRRYGDNALAPKASVVAPKPFKERRRGRFHDDPRTMPSAAPAPVEAPQAEPGDESPVASRVAPAKDERTAEPQFSGQARVASLRKAPRSMPGERAGVQRPMVGRFPTTFLSRVNP